ncbi:hypothetical protein [Deinococcus alpinitundrae]|uniref:hypothetical protein n=1 Tax=Deinococcus alpinitundrae TaxID=468913 RepID=UPI001379DD14|nr:hypothetical protein [Deinococcus alpinitundrae]
MTQPTTIRNSASSRAARTVLVLASFSVLGLPTLAASTLSGSQGQLPQAQKQPQKSATPAQGNRPDQMNPRGPADRLANLDVSYYSGDPLAGGKLLGTVRLTPPRGAPVAGNRAMGSQAAGTQATTPRPNPLTARAPAGARFAVIKDDHGGARIIDLSQADQRMDGQAGRGGSRSRNGTPPQR